MKVGDGVAGPEEPLQLLRVRRRGRCLWAASATASGTGLREGRRFASPSPGSLPVSWERRSDPNVKRSESSEGKLGQGWGWGRGLLQ